MACWGRNGRNGSVDWSMETKRRMEKEGGEGERERKEILLNYYLIKLILAISEKSPKKSQK